MQIDGGSFLDGVEATLVGQQPAESSLGSQEWSGVLEAAIDVELAGIGNGTGSGNRGT